MITLSQLSQTLAFKWSMLLPWVPAGASYAVWGSVMAESRTDTIPSFLRTRKYPLTGLSHISESDVNYDTSIILHKKGAVHCKPLERVSKPMAQYWSQAGVGASFWNGAPPASSFSVVFLFKHFLNVSMLVIPAQKRILICNMWYKSCKHT